MRKMNITKWHPFPQEIPEADGFYLVTSKNETTGAVTIDLNHWGFHTPSGEPDFFPHKGYSILAWAEQPKPYEPPEPETTTRMQSRRGRMRKATRKRSSD